MKNELSVIVDEKVINIKFEEKVGIIIKINNGISNCYIYQNEWVPSNFDFKLICKNIIFGIVDGIIIDTKTFSDYLNEELELYIIEI